MIATVSTVKDTADNVARFIDRNCANGVDHLFIFVDDDSPEVRDVVQDDCRVTFMMASEWWADGNRPPGLNRRQNTNANVVNSLLAAREPVISWLFHIDADEVLSIDREQLESAATDVDTRAAHLDVLEVVSHPDSDGTYFKRRLAPGELSLLAHLGLTADASGEDYFRGHTMKSGIRPSNELRVGLHRSRLADGESLAALTAPWLRLLHYDSPSFEVFSRKWINLVTSGPRDGVRFRKSRNQIADSVETLLGRGLAAEVQERYLRRLYELHIEDSAFPDLRDLEMLERVDPDVERSAPREISTAWLDEIRGGLTAASHLDKNAFRTAPAEVRQRMSEEILAAPRSA